MSKLHQGQVESKRETTIAVVVKRSKRHPLYRKNFTLSTKFHVHDADQKANIGDTITFTDCPPVSKTKRFKLVEVIREAAK